jgi:RNA polymerase sigma-70 factor (ECF subfamily)
MGEAKRSTLEIIETLVDNHREFRAFLEHRVSNPADAEEILQAAFVKSVEKGDTIRKGESSVAWFYRLLRNAVIDHYRRRDVERRALEREAGTGLESEIPEPEVEKAICGCIDDLIPTLKSDYADLIRRVDLEDAAIVDVADSIGITPANLRVKLHRARAALRRRLELSCGTCTEHGCLDCSCGKP